MSLGTMVVVGAGQAGGWAAKTLRNEGFTGRIVLVGDEAHPPHERPPLSKAVLAGTAEPDSTHLFKRDAYDELGLDIRAGVAVAAIERSSRTAVLTSGETIVYDSLILCTGSAPRKLSLPGADSPRLHYLRTIDDAILLRPRLAQRAHLIVIGAGWIGLEVAATARKRGASVTVIEPLPRICARAAPPEISEHLLHLHERHGVSFRLGVGVAAIEDTADAVVVTLSDGTSVRGDAAVAGIGIMPNVAVAQAAGLEIDNGIIVDERTQTSDPCVFAAGDVANMPLGCLGARIRLESWANAQNQAIVAAKAALGKEGRYDELPWFWSDQYDLNLQMLGVPARWSEPVVRGALDGESFSLFYLEGENIVGVIAANAPRELRAAKRLMQQRKPVRAEDLANPATNLAKL
jgi:3-phenylpropionate/trans-cinnamate dioxygenase ferredoxin reductase component